MSLVEGILIRAAFYPVDHVFLHCLSAAVFSLQVTCLALERQETDKLQGPPPVMTHKCTFL